MSMRKLFLFVVLVCSWSVTFATNMHSQSPSSNSNTNATAVSQSHASSHSNSTAVAAQQQTATGGSAQQSLSNSNTANGGNGGAGGSSNQTQSANNQGNSLSTVSNYRDRLQAPDINAPAIYASGPCSSGKSVGLAGPGFGISGGKTSTDPQCDRREVARVLMGVNPALALKVLCSDPYVAAVATGNDCVSVEKQSEQVTSPVASNTQAVDLSPYATHEEVERAFKQSQAK